MEKLKKEVVKDVTTKKKYVKPDFEVINLEDTPRLLAASGPVAPANGGVGSNGLTINNL